MKVWITKYALTKGLFQVDAEIIDGKYARHQSERIFTTEWTKTREEAGRIAEEMRLHKIRMLQKQIKKLEALGFDHDT